MATLKDILQIANTDGGKFFVMDESGEIKLVIMPMAEYEKTLPKQNHKSVLVDAEKVNREITKAQLQEPESSGPEITITDAPKAHSPMAENQQHHKFVDMREEVIDPSFDFEGPKTDLDDL